MSAPVQTPVQIAWVTPDLAATEASLASLLGVKKWVRLPDVHFSPDTCTYRGQPADFHADISMSYLGDMQLELIQPVRGGPNVYTDFLSDSPTGGLHHICTEATDPAQFEAALAAAEEKGADIVSQGSMAGMRFAYLSDAAAGVPYLEIAFIPDEFRAFFDHIKQEQQ